MSFRSFALNAIRLQLHALAYTLGNFLRTLARGADQTLFAHESPRETHQDWCGSLLSGSDASIEAMSGRLGMSKCRLTSLMRLSHLAPEIVGALLAGRHSIELTPIRLLRVSKNLPHDWKEQRRLLGFAA